jgi:dipeptidyl aminopeptidase/acylaminoacyl peptidase
VNIPKSWEDYAAPKGWEKLQISSSQSEEAIAPRRLKQYSVTDLRDGRIRFTINAPAASSLGYDDTSKVVWGAASNRVILTNTFLPLDGVEAPERARRHRACAVAIVDLTSNDVQCITFSSEEDASAEYAGHILILDKVSFGTDDNEIIARFYSHGSEKRQRTETYHYKNRLWTLVGAVDTATDTQQGGRAASSQSEISLSIRQTLNDPPILWGREPKSGKEAEIWNPNPQLQHIRFGEASVYHWKDESGYEWTAGLIKPVGYSPGKRYPMVIQTHGFWDGLFITDGTFSTAYAARPLASAGFIVLQVGQDTDHRLDLQMASDQVRGYRSAVRELSSEGLIDPERVGIIGFSSNCWYVETALTEAPELFAAATVADGADFSYVQYLFDGDDSGHDERIHGGKPLGKNLANYMSLSVASNSDKIKAPLRIEAISPYSVLDEWELFSSLKMQHKPVDLIYFPDGQHILQKPLERLASQQGNVDWFRFWLQGYEDPDPGKADQYKRWQHLKDLQEAESQSFRTVQ